MKKISTLLTSTALAALLLTSCGTKTYHGTYQFQMGKNNADHIGIYMELSNEKIDVTQGELKVPMEKFTLKLDAPIGNTSSSEEGGDQSLIGGLLTYFKDGLTGGYKIEEKKEGEEDNHLTLVPVLDIAGLIAQITGGSTEVEGESSSSESSSSVPESFVIPSEFVDDIMIAKFNGNQIDVTVPVSLTDLMFQLYWYGFDIFDFIEEEELPEHKHGTHPTEEEIKEINKTFNSGLLPHLDLDALVKYGAGAAKVVEFRDFHQLTMTLKKAEL